MNDLPKKPYYYGKYKRKKRKEPVPSAESWAVRLDCHPSRGIGNKAVGGFNCKEHLYTVSTSDRVPGAAVHVTKDRTLPACRGGRSTLWPSRGIWAHGCLVSSLNPIELRGNAWFGFASLSEDLPCPLPPEGMSSALITLQGH